MSGDVRAIPCSRSRSLLASVVALCLLCGPALAQPGMRDGLFVTVPNPITDSANQQIRQVIEDGFRTRKLHTIVFDFNPNGLPSGNSSFGSSYELAKFIRTLRDGYRHFPPVTTVAFVHNETTQHTVLPVLACKQIVMSAAHEDKTGRVKGRLGDILRGQDTDMPVQDRAIYRSVAEDSGIGDVVERMMNRNFVLRKVKTAAGEFYVGTATVERWQKDGKLLQVDNDVPPGLEPGNALFDAELAHKIGLCQALYDTRAELAAALRLPRRSLAEDWIVGQTRVVWRVELKNATDKGSLDSLERRLKTAISRNANFIILQLEAPGGDTQHVASVANRLRTLLDNNSGQPIKTVAWVPAGASLGAATFLALGCSEIVMAESAVLGDFSYLREDKNDELDKRRTMLVQLAKEQGYPPLLFEATLDPKLVLYRAVSTNDPGSQKLMTEAEMEKDKLSAKPQWRNLGRIDRPDGQFLKIPASLAGQWGIANATNLDTVEALYAHYGLDASKVRVARDDWLDRVAEFFREPIVNFLLVMFGIVGLILEFKMPGTSVPGVIAAICFVLFFWAYSFVGEFTLLAVLLFVLGMILIGIEVFVLPGFGFTGISGLVLLLSSLALVTLERWPSTTQEWFNLGTTLSTFGVSLVAAMLAAVMVAWYLPNIPYANRLVLNPPNEEDEGVMPLPSRLLGAIGVAATPLRPAGKAQFGDDFLDVIAEGDYVNPGGRVQVIEMEGNRIVVKEV